MTLTKYRTCARPSAFNMYFDDSLTRDFFNNSFRGNSRVPDANVKETPTAFGIELAAPGMDKNDFQISVENETLTISAERKSENKNEGENYSRREFSYTNFTRSFSLPEIVDIEKIHAQYVNGILHVTLPKRDGVSQENSKKIVVE